MRTVKSNALLAILGLLIVLVVIRFWLSGSRHQESAQEMVEHALRTGSPEDQERAATRLEALAARTPGTESRNAVQPLLVRLFSESDNPGVRSAAMRGLATIWDYQCMPKLLDALDDPSLQVRQTAARSVSKLIEFDAHFDANAPTEQRAAAMKRLRAEWKRFEDKTLRSWQRRLQEKDANSKKET